MDKHFVLSKIKDYEAHLDNVAPLMESNLEFSQWNTVFGDNRLTAALVDRLIHHSHIVIFSGESYRLTQSIRRQRASP